MSGEVLRKLEDLQEKLPVFNSASVTTAYKVEYDDSSICYYSTLYCTLEVEYKYFGKLHCNICRNL